MPTVLRCGPYRLLFYASDFQGPIHVHVRRDANLAKFWVAPVRLALNIGFSNKELRTIEKLVKRHEGRIIGDWNAFFGRP